MVMFPENEDKEQLQRTGFQKFVTELLSPLMAYEAMADTEDFEGGRYWCSLSELVID